MKYYCIYVVVVMVISSVLICSLINVQLSIVSGFISIVPIPSSNEEIRLVDDAFGKISHMVSDGSWMVRVQAAKTLVSQIKPFTAD